jgi:glutamate 5-kinase
VVETISTQISNLMARGIEVILISSGTMAAGMRYLNRHAISAVGQSGVMNAYEKCFSDQ